MHCCATSWREVACPFLAAVIVQGEAGSAAVFTKVLCDRPTFVATRGSSVPPRAPGWACVLNQRARARRMRRFGRHGRALRRFLARGRPHITRYNHAQSGERWAREALVRAGARVYNDRRTGEA